MRIYILLLLCFVVAGTNAMYRIFYWTGGNDNIFSNFANYNNSQIPANEPPMNEQDYVLFPFDCTQNILINSIVNLSLISGYVNPAVNQSCREKGPTIKLNQANVQSRFLTLIYYNMTYGKLTISGGNFLVENTAFPVIGCPASYYYGPIVPNYPSCQDFFSPVNFEGLGGQVRISPLNPGNVVYRSPVSFWSSSPNFAGRNYVAHLVYFAAPVTFELSTNLAIFYTFASNASYYPLTYFASSVTTNCPVNFKSDRARMTFNGPLTMNYSSTLTSYFQETNSGSVVLLASTMEVLRGGFISIQIANFTAAGNVILGTTQVTLQNSLWVPSSTYSFLSTVTGGTFNINSGISSFFSTLKNAVINVNGAFNLATQTLNTIFNVNANGQAVLSGSCVSSTINVNGGTVTVSGSFSNCAANVQSGTLNINTASGVVTFTSGYVDLTVYSQ